MSDAIVRMQQLFDRRNRNKPWSGGLADGTRSGRGSTMEATRQFRTFLPQFVAERGISSIFDAPCGDFHWMKEVRFEKSVRYFGGDISPSLIGEMSQSYNARDRFFLTFDIVSNPFFDVDLWICRDCLFHLSLDFCLQALRNSTQARIPYVMLTSHYNVEHNSDIETGKFRRLDLLKPPFSLPEPIARCDEFSDHPTSRRFVGVWRGSDLAKLSV